MTATTRARTLVLSSKTVAQDATRDGAIWQLPASILMTFEWILVGRLVRAPRQD